MIRRPQMLASSAIAGLVWSLGAMAQTPATGGADALVAVGDRAQAAPGPSTSTGDTSRLGEIVVTATRRSSNLQTTPIAVSAIDSRLIAQANPRNIGDLAAFVPNFSASTITGFNAASFAIRGVGQTNIIVYFEPPVAVLADDFVVPSVQTQLLDTFDVAQVEVLRGPQGTLFGKNTTGGAVTVRTKRPVMNEISIEGRFEGGSFGTNKIQGAVNVPILRDVLAFRLVGGHEGSDGYYKNGACYGPVTPFYAASKFNGVSGCLDGKTLGGQDVWNARAKLLFTPTSRLTALFQYEYLRDRSASVPSVNQNYTYHGSTLFLTDLLHVVRQNPADSDPLHNAAITNRQDALLKMLYGQRITVDGLYLNVDYALPFGTVTNVLGYRNQRSRLPNSYAGAVAIAPDGQPLSFFDATRDDNRRTTQEEVRFASKTGTPFDFVAGFFYQKEFTDFCVSQVLGFLDLTGGPLPFGNWNDTPYILCNAQRAESKAGYVEGTYKVTPKVTLTGGFRYTWEDKTWYGRQQTFIPALGGGFDPSIHINNALDANVFAYPAGVITESNHAAEPTYRASASWAAARELFLYFTYSHGFKAGAFNDQIGGFAAFGGDLNAFREAARATKPEKANSYEVGVKSQFFDNRLRLNLTGFYVDYTDLQKQLNVPIVVNGQPNQVTLFVNAASANVKGIEAEAAATPFQGFTLRGILGYQDSKYNTYNAPGAGYNLALAPLDRAPQWQWTVDATYQFPLGRRYKADINADVNYVSRNLFTQSITDIQGNTFLAARALVNASITIADVDDRYYIRIVGQNLADKRYNTASQNVAGLWLNSQFGPPRYIGGVVGFRFSGR